MTVGCAADPVVDGDDDDATKGGGKAEKTNCGGDEEVVEDECVVEGADEAVPRDVAVVDVGVAVKLSVVMGRAS